MLKVRALPRLPGFVSVRAQSAAGASFMGASSKGTGQNATNVQIEVRVLMRLPRPVVQSERIQSSEGWGRRSNRRGPASYVESGQVGYAFGCLPGRSGFDSRTLRHEAKLDRRTEAGLSSPYRWVRLPLALPDCGSKAYQEKHSALTRKISVRI